MHPVAVAILIQLVSVRAKLPEPLRKLQALSTICQDLACLAGAQTGGHPSVGGNSPNVSNGMPWQYMVVICPAVKLAGYDPNFAQQSAAPVTGADSCNTLGPVIHAERPLKRLGQPALTRLCAFVRACGKGAGKGKFCIECGQFIGLQTAQPVVELIHFGTGYGSAQLRRTIYRQMALV